MPLQKQNGHSLSPVELGKALAVAGHAAGDTPSLDQLIANAVNHTLRGRLIPAGLALVQIKQIYEARDPKSYPPEQRTWQGFADKHIQMGFKRIEQCIGRVVFNGNALQCSECGVISVAHCDCGAVYISEHPWSKKEKSKPPSALARALEALKEHPDWANTRIAKVLNIDEGTVRKARKQIPNLIPNLIPTPTTTRITTTIKKPPNLLVLQEPLEGDVPVQQRWQWSLSLICGDVLGMTAHWDRHFPGWRKFECPSEIRVLIDQAIEAFRALQQEEAPRCQPSASARPGASTTGRRGRRKVSGGT